MAYGHVYADISVFDIYVQQDRYATSQKSQHQIRLSGVRRNDDTASGIWYPVSHGGSVVHCDKFLSMQLWICQLFELSPTWYDRKAYLNKIQGKCTQLLQVQ